MGYLSHLQTLFASDITNLSQRARLDIDPANGALLIHDPVSQITARAALDTGTLARRSFEYEDRSSASDEIRFDFKGTIRSLDRATLDRLAASPGETSAYLDGPVFYGNAVSLASTEIGGQDYLYLARKGGYGLEAYRLAENGALTPVQILGDTSHSHLRDVTALTTVGAGGQTFVVSASSSENGISLYAVDDTGALSLSASFGLSGRLPVSTPTGLTSLTAGDQSYVLLTSYGTSSLTVLEVTAGGGLEFRDQINDSLDTRFAGAEAIATHSEGDLNLIAVAGHDGGISLMQMLPNGRLLLRDTMVDQLDTALDTVIDLQFAQVAGRLELFVLSAGDGGLTRLEVDDTALGITASGRNGGAGNDLLSADASGGWIDAGDGDDVLLDGAGADMFRGGAGADVFVFHPDGQTDRIFDFNPGEDRLDFGAYETVHDISAFSYRMTSNGAVLGIGDEELQIVSHNSRGISRAELQDALSLAADHVLIGTPLPRTGGSGNDLFEVGAQSDTVDGGAGYDMVSYEYAPLSAQVDLALDQGRAGPDADHVLIDIEGVVGSAHNDLLCGDDAGNMLSGGAGHDTLEGGAGADWLMPGAGSNVIDGGSGRDMISFVDLADTPGRLNTEYRLDLDLSAGRAVSHDGSETNLLSDIERVTGTIFADRIKGDGHANELRGLGDYDWFVGSYGNDTYDGGTGRDVISYVDAKSGVTVDLAAGQGTRGLAAGDSYTSIERATGSSHADLFFGDDNPNDFRGLGGYDTFVGSAGGRERYDGGAGLDTVSYFMSTAGVTASLLRGYGSGGDAARDLYTSIENLTGSGQGDILTGDHERNILRGLSGDDVLYGNGGVDRLEGGRGNDRLDGGAGWDYALFSGARAEYTITTSGTSTLVHHSGIDGVDTLIGIEVLSFSDGDVIL